MSNKLSIKFIQSGSLSVPDGSVGTGSTHIAPKNIEWYQGPDDRDVVVVSNDKMLDADFIKNLKGVKIAWLIEPCEINGQYSYINTMKEYFDYILVHDMRYVDNNKVLYCPLAGHWIKDKQIYPKSKMLSTIASANNNLEGHRLRHLAIKTFPNQFDGIFGRGYSFIEDKTMGLKDYYYHLVIENVKRDCWFTEKLIDAFVTGCLPIYWGCPSIDKYFDERGMIIFDRIEHLNIVFKEYLNPSYYEKCLPYIKENFKIAMNDFLTPEDYMFNHLFEFLK